MQGEDANLFEEGLYPLRTSLSKCFEDFVYQVITPFPPVISCEYLCANILSCVIALSIRKLVREESKSDEFSEKCLGAGGSLSIQKFYVADFGILK